MTPFNAASKRSDYWRSLMQVTVPYRFLCIPMCRTRAMRKEFYPSPIRFRSPFARNPQWDSLPRMRFLACEDCTFSNSYLARPDLKNTGFLRSPTSYRAEKTHQGLLCSAYFSITFPNTELMFAVLGGPRLITALSGREVLFQAGAPLWPCVSCVVLVDVERDCH